MTPAPRPPVATEEVSTYQADGVVCLRGIFPLDWIALMAEAVDQAIAAPGALAEEYEAEDGQGRFFGDLDVWRRQDGFRRFVLESPAAAIAGAVMRAAKVNFFYDQLLVKEPGLRRAPPGTRTSPIGRSRAGRSPRSGCRSIRSPGKPAPSSSGARTTGRPSAPITSSTARPTKGPACPNYPTSRASGIGTRSCRGHWSPATAWCFRP